jgi:putative redox protein
MSTSSVVVHNRGGFRTEVEAGPHRLVLDEPVDFGGSGEGPTPYDALAAGLGGCTAMTLQFYARREGFPLDAVDVTVSHDRQHAKDCADCVTQAGFIHRFRVEIALHGALSEEQRQRLLHVASRCPVARTLQSEIKVDDVLVGAAGGATATG